MNQQAPRFREVQLFRQIWIWLIILIVAGLMWYALITQIFLQRPYGTNPMPDAMLIIFWLIFGIGFPLAAYFTKLITEVRADGIYIRYVPFHRTFRRIGFTEVKQCETRVYRPILEYGGWGIRFGFKGRAYNVSGNKGVQLVLADGRQLLIGSQQADDLQQVISNALQ